MQWWGHGVEALEKSFDVKWLPRAASSLTKFWGKFPAQLGSGGRRSVLRLSVQDKSLRGKIRYWLNKIAGFPLQLNCIAVEW